MVHIYNGIYQPQKKNETMPLTAKWMGLEISTPSEVMSEREWQISYGIAYMWNLKYDTNELIYKTEIDAQT